MRGHKAFDSEDEEDPLIFYANKSDIKDNTKSEATKITKPKPKRTRTASKNSSKQHLKIELMDFPKPSARL